MTKRIPKPKMMPETRFIIDWLMPILEINEEQVSLEFLWKKVMPLANIFTFNLDDISTIEKVPYKKWGKSGNGSFLQAPLPSEDSEKIKITFYLAETITNAKEMIRLASTAKEPSPEYLKRKGYFTGNLSGWIEESLKRITYKAEWYEPRFTQVRRVMNPFENTDKTTTKKILETVRAGIVYVISRAFSAWNKDEMPNGTHYIGVCPREARIYIKERSNQIFCSKACADLVSKRQQRARVRR